MGHFNSIVQQNGLMVQRYYFIPRDLLQQDVENELLIFEEEGGVNLDNVQIILSTMVVP